MTVAVAVTVVVGVNEAAVVVDTEMVVGLAAAAVFVAVGLAAATVSVAAGSAASAVAVAISASLPRSKRTIVDVASALLVETQAVRLIKMTQIRTVNIFLFIIFT